MTAADDAAYDAAGPLGGTGVEPVRRPGVDGKVQQSAGSARGRVLLVADAGGAENLVRALEREYDVTVSGEDGLLERVDGSRPDVLILDLGRAGLDASEVVRTLRHDASLEDTAVLVLAEPALEDRAVAALEAGANDHLLKPFSLQALLARVRYALAVSRTCKELAAARQTLQRVRDLEQARRDLLNLAAHELRSPLTVVMGYVSMLQEGAFGPLQSAELRTAVPVMLEKLEEMEQLVKEMLETARLEEHTPDLAVTLIDLQDVVAKSVENVTSARGGAERIIVDMEQRPLLVAGERPRVMTIVRNLVDNAVKFSPDGGNVRITGRADPNAHRATIAVSDSGIGIKPEERERLFQRFGRLPGARSRGIDGTGLGLFLSRELAQLHGGDITVSGNSEGGSTFTLSLPLAGPRPGYTALGGGSDPAETGSTE